MKFLNKANFFSSVQFGFQRDKSAEDALLNFCAQLHSNLDTKLKTASLFVDITKAFDMVNHDILLRKLHKAGFRGFILKWFKSYLTNRIQRVKIEEIRSGIRYMNIGVPQGSVLGPVLFLIYITALFSLDFKGVLTAFADDIGCVYGSVSPLDLISDINWDLNLFRVWFAEHKLVISSKTKLMFFSLSNQNTSAMDIIYHAPECQKFKLTKCACYSAATFSSCLDCSSNCFVIEQVNEFKYLGLILDSNLSFSNHTEALRKYFRCTLRHFFYLKSTCSPSLLTIIYYGVFHSKLQYGICCWGGTYFNKIQPLLILQKYIVRKIFNKSRLHHSFPLFRDLNILPIRHLYIFKVLKAFFAKSGNLNFRVLDDYNLRGNSLNLVSIPLYRTTAFKNFYTVSCCRLFNKLPLRLRALISAKKFLKHLKTWLFCFEFNSIETLLSVQE